MSQPALEAKICERCGVSFGCGAGTGDCWCMSVPLDRQTLAELRAKYADCLCSVCLNQFLKLSLP